MTKRVENEYARYMEKHKGSGSTATLNVKDMVQHFYNLALADVKKELLNMLNTSVDNEHFFEQLDEFIDNQKQ